MRIIRTRDHVTPKIALWQCIGCNNVMLSYDTEGDLLEEKGFRGESYFTVKCCCCNTPNNISKNNFI